jgi:hypothetical protein
MAARRTRRACTRAPARDDHAPASSVRNFGRSCQDLQLPLPDCRSDLLMKLKRRGAAPVRGCCSAPAGHGHAVNCEDAPARSQPPETFEAAAAHQRLIDWPAVWLWL